MTEKQFKRLSKKERQKVRDNLVFGEEDVNCPFSNKPNDIIQFVDDVFPQFKGLCKYDKKGKRLYSKDITKVLFHYDTYHCMLGVTPVGKIT